MSTGNGEVDFNEFLTMMKEQMKKMDPEDELRELFQVFDMNSDGLIRQGLQLLIETDYGRRNPE